MTMLTGSRIISTCCFVAALVAVAGAAGAADVKEGDSYATVIEELGQPLSAFGYQGQQWLEYDRGKVNLKRGKVVSVDLVSPAEGRTRQKEREAEAEAMAEQRAAKAKAAKARRDADAQAKAEAKAKADAEQKAVEVTEEEAVGIPPGMNRGKRRRFARSKSRQEAWSNQVVEARAEQAD